MHVRIVFIRHISMRKQIGDVLVVEAAVGLSMLPPLATLDLGLRYVSGLIAFTSLPPSAAGVPCCLALNEPLFDNCVVSNW